MKAAVYEKYGPPEVLTIKQVDRPEIKEDEVLVKVYAAGVSTADWRTRASAFPGSFWLAGRMMFGLFAPKHKILGAEFAGRVVAKGESVTEFKGGDEVFGFVGTGTHAEYVSINQTKPIVKKPDNISYEEAAAVPFGATTALVFLRDFAKLQPGQRILITGASGGVGVFAVQLARHLGAHVTAVASTANQALLKNLGADQVIDYTQTDFTTTGETYDVIFDTASVSSFSASKAALTPRGLYLPLEFGLKLALQSLISALTGGKRVITQISGDSKKDLTVLADLLARGIIRPVIDSTYSLDQVANAHARVESRHKTGSVVLIIDDKSAETRAAA
jgi:NADPH:quinone reductase-like Zn-dependent oxidoreductase